MGFISVQRADIQVRPAYASSASLRLDVRIEPDDLEVSDRSMRSGRLREAIGYHVRHGRFWRANWRKTHTLRNVAGAQMKKILEREADTDHRRDGIPRKGSVPPHLERRGRPSSEGDYLFAR